MGYYAGDSDGDLSSSEKAQIGVSFADRVYLVRDSMGDVVAIRAIDPAGNRENIIDLKSPLKREGASNVLDAVRMVYSGMKKLPQNYVVSMSPDGTLTRGQRSGTVGYSTEKSLEENGRTVLLGVGNTSALSAMMGKRKAAPRDSYGAGGSFGSYGVPLDAENYGSSGGGSPETRSGGKDAVERGKLAGKSGKIPPLKLSDLPEKGKPFELAPIQAEKPLPANYAGLD